MLALLRSALPVAFLLGLVVACGSSDSDGSASSTDPVTGSLPPTGSLGGDGGAGNPGDFQACATSSAQAETRPLYLVFMFDRSLSMFGSRGVNRWGPCKAATQAFLISGESKGISASMHYFPQTGFLKPTCEPGTYAAPAVKMTALPSDIFKGSLDTQSPELGTPMLPAMEGAVQYATEIANGEGKNGKVAMVLVSDGEPISCGSSVTAVAKAVETVAKTLPTYVIGIGKIKALDAIATAGGTGSAVLVDDKDAATNEAEFRKALNIVATSALACDYGIPPPANGEKFERGKVNIVHKPVGEAPPVTILYNPTCEGGNGWKYDNEESPTRVLMCDGSCQSLKTGAGKVDVLFGCETQSAVVK